MNCARLLLAFLILPIPTGIRSPHAPQYTMETAPLPVRMSLDDLAQLIQKVQRFAQEESGPAIKISTDDLAVSDGVRRFQVSGPVSPDSLAGAPPVSYEVSYRYGADGDIQEISIELRDWSRHVSVSGPDSVKVEAISQLISASLQEHRSFFAGPLFRLIAAILFSWAGIALTSRVGSWKLSLLLMLGGIVLAAGFYGWGPKGVAVYRGDPSWRVRWGPQIGLLSLVLGALPLGAWLLARLRRETPEGSARKRGR